MYMFLYNDNNNNNNMTTSQSWHNNSTYHCENQVACSNVQ